jgi:hypothetical protein
MAAIGPEEAAIYGLSANKNNGIYNDGYEFEVEKKFSVQASYQISKRPTKAFDRTSPTLPAIARYLRAT